ncbi:MAG TPA: tetratricopeptide repeat protein [Pirellulaceae bacterium]|nr:tetratricopeptide repeat protein [Pirellulaceae bacterium]
MSPLVYLGVWNRQRLTGPSLLLIGLLSGCGMVARQQNVAGVRHFQQGQYPVAMREFQQAVQADPNSADAKYNLAATTHRLALQNRDPNLMVQAEGLYNECLDRDPNHVACHRGLAVLLTETQRVPQAFTLLRNWSVRSPTLADARIELGRLYEEYGDLATAEGQLQQALQLDVHNARANAALGELRLKKGDYQQALINYQRAYALNKSQPGVAERVAMLQRQTGSAGAPAPAPAAPPRSATLPQGRLNY